MRYGTRQFLKRSQMNWREGLPVRRKAVSGEVEAAEEEMQESFIKGSMISWLYLNRPYCCSCPCKVAQSRCQERHPPCKNVPHAFSWLPPLTDESCAAVCTFAVATAGQKGSLPTGRLRTLFCQLSR